MGCPVPFTGKKVANLLVVKMIFAAESFFQITKALYRIPKQLYRDPWGSLSETSGPEIH